MTILTKTVLADEKCGNPIKIEIPPENSENPPPRGAEPPRVDCQLCVCDPPLPPTVPTPGRIRLRKEIRSRFLTTPILIMLSALMVLTFVLLSLFVYRIELANNDEMTLLRGMCEIPYDENEAPRFMSRQSDSYNPFNLRVFSFWLPQSTDEPYNNSDGTFFGFDQDIPSSAFGGFDNTEKDSDLDDYFREKYELSLNNQDKFFAIDVLNIKDAQEGRFVHAFNKNQTAIIDRAKNRCFVMPLDFDTTMQPNDFADILKRMYNRDEVNTERVRMNMEIKTPKLEDLSDLSPRIQDECQGMNIYMLDKYNSELFKREAGDEKSAALRKYAEFSGKGVVEYNLVNLNDIDHLEAKPNH